MPLTKRQSEILAYLQGHIQDHGYAPSFEEIAEHFGFNTVDGARMAVNRAMQRLGIAMKEQKQR